MSPLVIILVVIGVLVLYFIGTYNSLVVLKTRINEALSGIDVQLKRRADLIPNLVETVKSYVEHEREVFENVTNARASLIKAETLGEKAKANNQLTEALKSLFALAEAYPQLQASSNFLELQKQLEDTEDKIAYSRQFYNSNVLAYNAKIKIFPSNIIANWFGFKETEFFVASDEEKKAIKVSF